MKKSTSPFHSSHERQRTKNLRETRVLNLSLGWIFLNSFEFYPENCLNIHRFTFLRRWSVAFFSFPETRRSINYEEPLVLMHPLAALTSALVTKKTCLLLLGTNYNLFLFFLLIFGFPKDASPPEVRIKLPEVTSGIEQWRKAWRPADHWDCSSPQGCALYWVGTSCPGAAQGAFYRLKLEWTKWSGTSLWGKLPASVCMLTTTQVPRQLTVPGCSLPRIWGSLLPAWGVGCGIPGTSHSLNSPVFRGRKPLVFI